MTAANSDTGGGSTRRPSARAPIGRPGLRWAGDGALAPAHAATAATAARAGGVPAGRIPGAHVGPAPRVAPSGAAIASFPRRSAGFVIDFLLVSAIYAVVLALVFGDAEPADIGRIDSTWLPFVTTGMLVRLAYNWYWNRRGWSPGKRAWGLRLEGTEGQRPTLGRALMRALFAEVSLFLWLGYVWAAWDRRGQTWHDRVAATWVVRAEPATASDKPAPPR